MANTGADIVALYKSSPRTTNKAINHVVMFKQKYDAKFEQARVKDVIVHTVSAIYLKYRR